MLTTVEGEPLTVTSDGQTIVLTDAKGGKLRVVRCILTQGDPPTQFDLLFKLDKAQGNDHAIDQAVNPAGNNWKAADKIPWQSLKPKDEG